MKEEEEKKDEGKEFSDPKHTCFMIDKRTFTKISVLKISNRFNLM